MPNRHSKIEHVLIHFVAIVFTFSAIVSALLGYDIYQNNKQASEDYKVTPPVQAATAEWTQTSWSGGTSGSVYALSWGSTGGWNKYSSASGLTVGGSGFTLANGGQLISSIFDTGSKKAVSISDGNGGLTVSVRGANTSSGVSSASWSSSDCNLSKYRYVQYKFVNNTDIGQISGSVMFYSAQYNIWGIVKDSSGNPITGATVNGGGTSSPTALNKSNFLTRVALAAVSKGFYYLPMDFVPSKTVSVTASKSGYNSQTKTVTLPASVCSGSGTTLNLTLTKSSSSSGSSSSSSSGSTATSGGTGTAVDTTPIVSLSTLQDVNLPKIFLAKGSKTTDLSKVKDHKKVKDFTLDIPGKSRIVFKETLNLSTEKTIDLLKNLDKYVKMDKIGKITVDSKALPALNKKATLTMEKLKHISTPEVLVDGKKDTKGIVDNTKYDKEKGTFTFDVSHFTSFEAAPKLELLSPTDGSAVTEENPVVRGKVSDPNAKVTGRFNEVDLAEIAPNKETGEFTITNLVLKEGENFLTLEATSDLGKVLPAVATITYDPSGAGAGPVTTGGSNTKTAILAVVLIGALAFLVLLGYLAYRRRKHSGGGKKDTRKHPAAVPQILHS